MTYGEKIASLRKAHNLTQAEFGERLCVSFQAVSKWENNQSTPDIDTIKKICELFNISTDEFLDMPAVEQPQTIIRETIVQQPIIQEKIVNEAPAVILGYCEDCKKPLHSRDEYVVERSGRGGHIQHIYCNECKAKRVENKRRIQAQNVITQRKKGFIWGAVGGIVLSAILIVTGIVGKDNLLAILGGVLGLYGGFAFIAQMIWGNSVMDCFAFFIKSFHLPGIIFTLDIEGIIFLITVKLIGAILCAILSVLLFLLGLIITIGYSMISFPVAVGKQIKGDYSD